MKLAIFNGSPRKKNSNSDVLIRHFLYGYNRIKSDTIPVYYLAGNKQEEERIKAFLDSETIIIIFPLYTDCMPGIVKEFIENISEKELPHPKKIGFIVQSGFPESIHSVFVERYLEKLTKRLNCEYMGTIIKGGVEGIKMMPGWMTKKIIENFRELGSYMAENNCFSSDIQKRLREPYKMTPIRKLFFSFMQKTGLSNFYWNSNLKKNGAFEKRFDKPYAK